MLLVPEPLEFEWDSHNAAHIGRHGIESSTVEEVFFNMPLIIGADEPHSRHEARCHALGRTNAGELLMVVFTIRRKRIRPITARRASRKERKAYEEG